MKIIRIIKIANTPDWISRNFGEDLSLNIQNHFVIWFKNSPNSFV